VKHTKMAADIVKGFENKTIGIVGLGYIGRHLFQVFQKYQSGFNLRILCFNRENLNKIGDIEVDYLFNCAGYTGDFRTKPFETIDANINLPVFLLKNARIKTAFVSLSSTRIYGFTKNKKRVFTELDSSKEQHTEGGYIYDGSKMMMESLLLNHAKTSDFKIVIPRLSNVFGRYTLADLDDSTFLKVLLKASISPKKIETAQNKNSAKDYIFIDDAVEGILRVALFSKDNTCYNICSGQSHTLKTWADYLDIKLECVKNTPPQYSTVSYEKARIEIGFKPRHSLKNISISEILYF
jgi:nucleoside-diphosphate-sugar epimerase